MSKELEALEHIKHSFEKLGIGGIPTKYQIECLDIIETALKELEVKREVIGDILTGDDENKLKALETIKKLPKEEKQVLLNVVYTYTKSEEEYDLLKKVLL